MYAEIIILIIRIIGIKITENEPRRKFQTLSFKN